MVDLLMAGLGVLIFLVFVFMVKVVLDAQSSMNASFNRLEEKLASLEHTALQVNSDVASLKNVMQDKVDKSYVEKRLDGLLRLVKKKL